MKSKSETLAVFLLASVTLYGCSDKRSGEDALAQDTSLTRDLALANQDTASQPQLRDVPVSPAPAPVVSEPEPAPAPRAVRRAASPPPVVRRPAPRRTAPAPAPAPAAPIERVTESGNTERSSEAGSERPLGVVSVGSEIALASGQRICTNTNAVGDRFTAQIAEPVMGANGTVIPVGATALVSISSLHKSERSGDNIEIGLRVESITFGGRTYQVGSEVTYAQVDRVRAESRSDDIKKVAAGAAIGAVIGQILGHKTKSTVIGAATGAAAGAVVANRNANYDGCVPSGGRITIRLTEPLTIQATE
ncbi:MAG: YMGG-like glycine zipper-containing protein [Gemmatimonadales bacterium]